MQPIDSNTQEHTLLEEEQRSALVRTQTKSLGRTFIALRHRNYRLFFFGQMISQVGTWMQLTAQAWLVLQLTHSALLLGIVSLLQYLPVMIFSLYGGVVADRVPKRTLLLVTQSISLVQSAIMWLLVIAGVVQVWHVLLLVALLGITNALDSPTRNAFINEMVGHEDLPNAIALNSSLATMARVLGPGLGGVLIASLGVAPLFLLNSLSFIAVIIGLFMIDTRTLYALPGKRTDDKKRSTLQSLREGLSYSWHMPAVLFIIGLIGGVGLFGMTFNVMLPLFATEVFHAGATGYGFIAAAYGLGALFSALWVAWGNRQPSIRFLLIAAFAFGILEIAFALSPMYIFAFPLLISIGFAQVVVTATSQTAVQTIVPNHLRGRIIGVYLLVYTGALPLGNFFAGALTTRIGVSTTFLLGAALSLVVASIAWLLRRPAEQSLEQSTAETRSKVLTEEQTRFVLQLKGKMMSDPHAHTALLLMDMQEGIVTRLPQQGDILFPVRAAIDAARAASIPIIYVVVTFRPGYPEISPNNKSFSALKERPLSLLTGKATEITSSLAPQPTDIVITKRRVSAFSGSDLEVVLRAQGISHLVLCGISTSGVVLSTLREAADKDYQVTILADCCFDNDAEVQRILLTKVFPRQAQVLQVETWKMKLLSGELQSDGGF